MIECCLFEKSQYVGKSKYSLNVRISTYRNDVWRKDAPPCDKHFQMPDHNLNPHVKFTFIEEVYNSLYQSWKFAAG